MINIWQTKNGPATSKGLDHNEFLNRIRKSLYCSKLPMTDCLSFPVIEFAAECFTEVKNGHTLERLDIEEASRISRNTCVSPCSLILALLYIEKLKNCNPEYLRQIAPSELFLVSLMVASKFLHDDGEDDEVYNAEWANSGQLSLTHMNKLEKDFLDAIEWAVFVRDQDFWKRLQQLEKDVSYREMQKRGWCTYTELSCLMNSVQLIAIAHILINVSSICLATYAAGLITLFGSALVASYLPGTSLNPTQSGSWQMNLTSTTAVLLDLIMETTYLEADNRISIPNLLICNETIVDCPVTQIDNDVTSWKWWHNSTMIWLPEYSSFQNNIEVIQPPRLFITNMKFSPNLAQLKIIEESADFASENCDHDINWKEVLSSDLNTRKGFLAQDWAHYSYIMEVFLSHRC